MAQGITLCRAGQPGLVRPIASNAAGGASFEYEINQIVGVFSVSSTPEIQKSATVAPVVRQRNT